MDDRALGDVGHYGVGKPQGRGVCGNREFRHRSGDFVIEVGEGGLLAIDPNWPEVHFERGGNGIDSCGGRNRRVVIAVGLLEECLEGLVPAVPHPEQTEEHTVDEEEVEALLVGGPRNWSKMDAKLERFGG